MTKLFFLLVSVLFIVSACSNHTKNVHEDRLTDFVDPFIGTGYHGHTFPGAAFLFGQIQLTPDNGLRVGLVFGLSLFR